MHYAGTRVMREKGGGGGGLDGGVVAKRKTPQCGRLAPHAADSRYAFMRRGRRRCASCTGSGISPTGQRRRIEHGAGGQFSGSAASTRAPRRKRPRAIGNGQSELPRLAEGAVDRVKGAGGGRASLESVTFFQLCRSFES
jgi:hypothetical protein